MGLIRNYKWFYVVGAVSALYGAFTGGAIGLIFGLAVGLIGTELWGWVPPEWRGTVPLWTIAAAGLICITVGALPASPLLFTLVFPLGISGFANIPKSHPNSDLQRRLHAVAAVIALGGAISCLLLIGFKRDPLNVLFGTFSAVGEVGAIFLNPLLAGAVGIWAIATAGIIMTGLVGTFIDLTWIVAIGLTAYGFGNFFVYLLHRRGGGG